MTNIEPARGALELWDVLSRLVLEGPCPLDDLAPHERLAVDRLEARGLVETPRSGRDPARACVTRAGASVWGEARVAAGATVWALPTV